MQKGFMKLSREKMLDWRWLNNQTKFYVFFRLLLMANFNDKPCELITIRRGQLMFSYESLSATLGVSVQTLRTTLRDLQKTNEINIQSTRRYSILTICDYDSWQSDENETNIKLTYSQHTDNKQITLSEERNKEIKEENTNVLKKKSTETDLEQAFAELSEENAKLKEENDALKKKKAKKAETKFVPPTIEEVDAYIKEKGYHFDAKSFVEYYEADDWHYGKGSNRKKVANWKRCCTTWEDNRKPNVPDIFDNVEKSEPNVLIIDGQIYR